MANQFKNKCAILEHEVNKRIEGADNIAAKGHTPEDYQLDFTDATDGLVGNKPWDVTASLEQCGLQTQVRQLCKVSCEAGATSGTLADQVCRSVNYDTTDCHSMDADIYEDSNAPA